MTTSFLQVFELMNNYLSYKDSLTVRTQILRSIETVLQDIHANQKPQYQNQYQLYVIICVIHVFP